MATSSRSEDSSCPPTGAQFGTQGLGVSAQAEGCGWHFPLCRSNHWWSWACIPETHRCVQTDTHMDTHTEDSHQTRAWTAMYPSPPGLAERRSLVQHAHHTLQVHKHTHTPRSPKQRYSPSACLPPLPDPRSLTHPMGPHLPAGPAWRWLQTHSTHMPVPQASHTHGSPHIPAWTLCPPNKPAQTQGLPYWLARPAWSLSATLHAHPMQTQFGEGMAFRTGVSAQPQIQCVAAEMSFKLL